ncbi:MAG: hypothetical protein VCC20_14150, partial [Myxococcota bacterium]
FCNGSETCDATLDCQAGTGPNLSDGVDCTDDTCDDINDVVVNTANDVNCDDALFCNGAETCDAVNGCQGANRRIANDGVFCTVDFCDEDNDVVVNAANNALCDDLAFCNGVETCDAVNGCQAGTAPTLTDGVLCTNDTCDDINDVVVNTPDSANCDDNNVCTADACDEVVGCTHVSVSPCYAPVPATSRWGEALLVTLLLATAIVTLRRRYPRPTE